MFSIVKQRKIWFITSGLLVTASVALIAIFGFNLGIDFEGGSLLEVEFLDTRPSNQEVASWLSQLNTGAVIVQPVDERGMILRFKEVDEVTHQRIIKILNDQSGVQVEPEGKQIVEEKRFDSIGPSIGLELKRKTVNAVAVVSVAIILYIAWAFRKISQPIASWKYGLIAIIALFHDIVITLGVFVLLGEIYGVEINAPFIAALLTILGYSVNDTIVVFDRTRENLAKNQGEDFEKIVQKSVSEVIVRSINASLTTLLVLFSILLLGGSTVREFVLALIIGIGVGTYSSIFIASPLLVTWEKLRLKRS